MRWRLFGGLGDVLAATAAVREVKRQHPAELIVVEGDKAGVFAHSPRVNWGNGPNRWGDVAPELNLDLGLGSMPHSFARQLGFELTDDTPEIFLTDAERAAAPTVAEPGRTLALDPWAFWAARRWPYARFVELTARLRADGWRVLELGRRTRAAEERRAPLAVDETYFNRLTVRQTAALLERCALFVGNDSGMMHLAAAVGTPQVAVFGPVPWYARAYYTTTPVFAYAGCGDKCFVRCVRRPGGADQPVHSCLADVSVARVADAVAVAARRFPYWPAPGRPERRTARSKIESFSEDFR